MKLIIEPCKLKNKKYTAIFSHQNKITKVHFGASGYSDFILSGGDKKKREAYIKRHQVNENWTDPMTPATLSRYILWGEYPDLNKNINLFKKLFNLT